MSFNAQLNAPSAAEPAIRVRDVHKSYKVYANPKDRLAEIVSQNAKRHRVFEALSSINFDVAKGETLGIVGRNGSGKSTLLQIICGTLQPSAGDVQVKGRIAALLELGAGFNPEFTGRENVYMNATILGASKSEIDDRFESIAQFADIGPFIEQPVKTYSSGMYVRLAFAVAINVDPDILIVDEALSVGDEAFQRKCFARIEQIQDRGGTILFVSHSAGSITQLCNRAMLIDRGEIILDGSPKNVVNYYQRFMNLTGADAERAREEIKTVDGWATKSQPHDNQASDNRELDEAGAGTLQFSAASGDDDKSWFDPALTSPSRLDYDTKGASLEDVRFETLSGRKVNVLQSGQSYFYKYRVRFTQDAHDVYCGMFFKNLLGQALGGASTGNSKDFMIKSVKAGTVAEFQFRFDCNLRGGSYVCSAGVTRLCEETGAQVFAGRILDAVLFKVHNAAQELAVGPVDLNPSLTIDFVTQPSDV